MAKTVDQYFDDLRDTRVWRSIFRSGTGSSTLKRALAIQQNVFLHLFSTKVRTRMLSFSATWYLGTLTLGTFLILVATGIPLMLYYHPSAPQAYADTKDLQFVVSSGIVSAQPASLVGARHGVSGIRAHVQGVLSRRVSPSARIQLGDRRHSSSDHACCSATPATCFPGINWRTGRSRWDRTLPRRFRSIGEKIHFLLLGGNAVNANALLRFYVLHCMILPLAAMFFVAIHFWRIRKDGGLYSHASEPATVRAQAADATAPAAKEAQ